MPAQIRPTRLEVTDRFPMLAFTIRTPGDGPRRAEIALATEPGLLAREARARRTLGNFFSSRAHGDLQVPRGEAVYVVPPEVLARFVGADRLYFGLATATNGAGKPEIDLMPTDASPYVSLAGLSGRSLRRVRTLPSRERSAAPGPLEWAGDVAQPGASPVGGTSTAVKPEAGAANGGAATDAAPGTARPYDDGFGPLPTPTPAPTPANAVQAMNDGSIDPETMGIEGPAYSEPSAGAQAWARAQDAGSPDYDRAARFVASPARTAAPGGRSIDRIVIHITDAPTTSSTVNHFTRADANSSAHYLVGQDGEIIQFVREAEIAWHAKGANRRSIGIEHVCVKEGGATYGSTTFPHLPPSDIQYAESAALVSHLCAKYGIPVDRAHIIGHAEADATTSHSTCPSGAPWNWDHFVAMVSERVSRSAQSPTSALGARAMGSPPKIGRALNYNIVTPIYLPSDAASAGALLAEFQARYESWKAGVENTRFAPHSAICHFETLGNDGNTYVGTGFYVASDLILTAAHVLADAKRAEVFVGRNGTTQLARFSVSPPDWSVHPAYDQSQANDLAVIRTSTPPPGGTWFELEEQTQSTGDRIIVCGYAAEHGLNPRKQHLDGDFTRELSADGETMSYNLQTTGGTSGSPVFYVGAYEDHERRQSVIDYRAIGVHVALQDQQLNKGCRLTQSKIDWIRGRGLASAQAFGDQRGDAAIVRPPLPGATRDRARRIGGDFAGRINEGLDLGVPESSLQQLINALDPSSQPQPLAARAQSQDSFSLSWDGVEVRGQRHGLSCWAASLAMLLGWRDGQSIDEAAIVDACGRAPNQRGPIQRADVLALAGSLGLEHEEPQTWTVDGFRNLLETKGPIWFCKQMSEGVAAGHAVLVIGMYADATGTFVRVADPWDREIGQPGAPGIHKGTHESGSRYIQRYEDFLTEYQWQQRLVNDLPPDSQFDMLQVLHADGTNGRTPILHTPVGYAQGFAAHSRTSPPPAVSRLRALSLDAAARTIGGEPIEVINGGLGGVTWSLDSFSGFKHPGDRAPSTEVAKRDGEPIMLDRWPDVAGEGGATSAWFKIDWQHDGKSIGNIRIANLAATNYPGSSLHVDARIVDDSREYQPNGCAALQLRFAYSFKGSGEARAAASTHVVLYGDGTYDVQSVWEADPKPIAVDPPAVKPGAQAMDAIGTASTIIGFAGDEETSAPAWLQTRHPGPGDTAPPGAREWKKQRITIKNPPVSAGPFDKMTVNWVVDWEYDGLSLRNIYCYPQVDTAILSTIRVSVAVEPRESRRSNIYLPTSPMVAVVDVVFVYRFSHTIDDDENAVFRATLYGDGGSWQMPQAEWISGAGAFWQQFGRKFRLPVDA